MLKVMVDECEYKVKYYQKWYGEKCPYKQLTNTQQHQNQQLHNQNSQNNQQNKQSQWNSPHEREYTQPITKGLTLQPHTGTQQQLNQHQNQQQIQIQKQKQYEAILGPKKSRPNSAIRPSSPPSSSPKSSSQQKRPMSGLKRTQKKEMSDELIEDNAVLMIR